MNESERDEQDLTTEFGVTTSRFESETRTQTFMSDVHPRPVCDSK